LVTLPDRVEPGKKPVQTPDEENQTLEVSRAALSGVG
jgi:hypothetical protein